MASGSRGAVDWAISGNTSDVQGNWDAEFYSESDYVGQFPDGVVGTFTAAFDADVDGDATFDEIIGAYRRGVRRNASNRRAHAPAGPWPALAERASFVSLADRGWS